MPNVKHGFTNPVADEAVSGTKPSHWNAEHVVDQYVDVSQVAVPANPSAGTRRVFTDVADGKLKVRTSAGTTIELEGSGGAADPHGAAAHTGDVIPAANQDFGAFYSDLAQIAAPANPGATVRRVFVDSADGKLKVRTSAGASVSLEEQGGTISNFWVNVKNSPYNATGNAKRVTNGAITTGTAVLTSASNPWVSGDVGRSISVEGAAASSNVLKTTILSFQSAGSITLNANASTTVSGKAVHWGTDDTTAIQSAIDSLPTAAPNQGGIVFFPAGQYYVSSLTLPTRVALVGEGRASVLVQDTDVLGGDNFVVKISTDDTRVIDMAFQGIGNKTNGNAYGIRVAMTANTNRTMIRDCFFTGFSAGGIAVGTTTTKGSNVTIDGCDFYDNGERLGYPLGIAPIGTDSCAITNCTFERSGADRSYGTSNACIDLEPNSGGQVVTNVAISSCTFRNFPTGVAIVENLNPGNVHHISITNCVMQGLLRGIEIGGAPYGVTITGNTIHDCDKEAINMGAGVDNVVTGNTCLDNNISAVPVSHVTLGTSKRTILANNRIGNKARTTAIGYSIYEYGDADFNIIYGNNVQNSTGASGTAPIQVSGPNTIARDNFPASADAGVSEGLQKVRITDDFLTGIFPAAGVGGLGCLNWVWLNGTAPSGRSTEANRPGVVMLNSSTTSGTRAYMHLRALPTTGLIDPSLYFDLTMIVRLETTDANTVVRLGLGNDATADPPAAGIFFEKLLADTQWFGVTRSASVETRSTNFGTVAVATWYKFRIRRLAWNSIGFTVNASAEQALTTNVPTGTLVPFFMIGTGNTTQKRMDIDLFDMTLYNLAR